MQIPPPLSSHLGELLPSSRALHSSAGEASAVRAWLGKRSFFVAIAERFTPFISFAHDGKSFLHSESSRPNRDFRLPACQDGIFRTDNRCTISSASRLASD